MHDRGVIFDMDGLLIDSEPLWRQAEVAVFAGVGLELEESQCELTMGLRADEVVAYWYARAPWQGPSLAEVHRDLVQRVGRLVEERGEALPGAVEAVALARELGCRVALASSSEMSLIRRVIHHLGLDGAFEVVCSAEHEERGKPDPAVFLTAARRLGLPPASCVVLEDSGAGVRAARAAGMRVVAVPAANQRHHEVFTTAQHRLNTLTGLTPEILLGDDRRGV